MSIITIVFSVPQHSALSFLAEQYRKNRRVSPAKLVSLLVSEHVKTPDIAEPMQNLTDEKRDRKVKVTIQGTKTKLIREKMKKAKGDFENTSDYIWQLIGQYIRKHVQTFELQNYEGKKTGREIK